MNHGIGSITVEKLQAQLYFYIFHRTFNEYIAHVLSGKDSKSVSYCKKLLQWCSDNWIESELFNLFRCTWH